MTVATEVLAELEARSLHLAIAESITGGGLGAELTNPPGASKVVLGSIVAYQTPLKHELLGVSTKLLRDHGAVHAQVAAQMAYGARAVMAQKCEIPEDLVWGISTTGVAGPDSQDGKPVGQVFVALVGDGFEAKVLSLELTGTRGEIRSRTIDSAIELLWEQIGA